MSHLVFVETSGSGVHAIDYAKQAGHTVTYLHSPRYDFTATPEQRKLARMLADHPVELPDGHDPADVLASMRAAGVRIDGVDAVLSTLAFAVPLAAALVRRTGITGTPADAVHLARDKGRCREALRDAGVPNLAFAVVRSADEALVAAEEIGYPVIVKPVLGVAKVATTIAHTPDQVREHFAGPAGDLRNVAPGMSAHFDDRFIVEELAVGDLFSVEVAADGESFVPLVSTIQKTGRDNPVVELGCTVPSGLDPAEDDELKAYAVRVCRTLGLRLGVFHVEAIRTAQGFRLTEANPRMAGGALPETVNAVAEQNMFTVLVDLYAGHPVPAPPRLSGAASHSVLGAAVAGMVREDLPPDWFDAFLGRLHSGWACAQAGGTLDVMRGNFDRFGMIRALDTDITRAEATCVAIKSDIERELGIPLVPEKTRTPSASLRRLP